MTKKVSNDTLAKEYKRDSNLRGRPAHKELTGKIRSARTILLSHGYKAAETSKLAENFRELDLFSLEEQMEALGAALREISPEDYAGSHPPSKSYERLTRERELFAFSWNSEHFKKKMYFKFCLVNTTLFVFSLHESTPKGGGQW
ncbi:MAG TPA: hypothetical protein VK604_12140 [Bryobacteraceae bacterium]|nr:hypothetical protein [Bryobacteraceae bacterium]